MLHDRMLIPHTRPDLMRKSGHLLRRETPMVIIMTLEDAPKIR